MPQQFDSLWKIILIQKAFWEIACTNSKKKNLPAASCGELNPVDFASLLK
jgi:hypothetical protein